MITYTGVASALRASGRKIVLDGATMVLEGGELVRVLTTSQRESVIYASRTGDFWSELGAVPDLLRWLGDVPSLLQAARLGLEAAELLWGIDEGENTVHLQADIIKIKAAIARAETS